MVVAPKWLNVEQINKRLNVLQTVDGLLSLTIVSNYSSVSERFDYAVAVTARRLLREAEASLRTAATRAEENGAAPVEQAVLDVVTTFNSIGPIRLEQYYHSLTSSRWGEDHATSEDADAIATDLLEVDQSNNAS